MVSKTAEAVMTQDRKPSQEDCLIKGRTSQGMPQETLILLQKDSWGGGICPLPLAKWRRNSATMTDCFSLVLRSFLFAVHSEIRPSQLAETRPGSEV